MKFLHFSKCWWSVTNAPENLGKVKQADSIVVQEIWNVSGDWNIRY
jgi:hypothetical protein